jgi:Uma2 family endonuclease
MTPKRKRVEACFPTKNSTRPDVEAARREIIPMESAASEKLLTAEELLAMPDDGRRYELVKGELVSMAAAGGRHGIIASRLDHRLRNFVEAHGLGEVCAAETGFRLTKDPDTVRAPDVSFITRQRLPAGEAPDGFWPFAPDLAVEVVSPSDRFDDVLSEVQEYLSAGTRLVWVFHPRTKTVMVYRANGEVVWVREQDELSGEDVLPGFRCRVAELFG